MAFPYRCKRGATLVIPLEAVGSADADLAGVTIDAGLKVALAGGVPPEATPRVITFAHPSRASTSTVGPGWNLTLTAAQTIALDPGKYVTDAVLTLADGSTKTISEPLFIEFDQAVSV